MKKFLLVAFILVDLVLIGASVFVLYSYLGKRSGAGPIGLPGIGAPKPTPAPVPSTGTFSGSPLFGGAIGGGEAAMPSHSPSTTRKMLFSYRNAKARQVFIRADFTGWKPEAMQRDPNGIWSYQANLTPGEYAYCFGVDDRPPIKDPNNKRTKKIGRAVVSSILVEPLSSKGSK